jgi:hypothetical protein
VTKPKGGKVALRELAGAIRPGQPIEVSIDQMELAARIYEGISGFRRPAGMDGADVMATIDAAAAGRSILCADFIIEYLFGCLNEAFNALGERRMTVARRPKEGLH